MTTPVLTGLLGLPTTPAAPTARYVPDVRITVNGAQIPRDVRSSVLSVRYDDGINAADRVEIVLANVGLRWLSGHVRGLGVRPYPTGVRLGPVQFADGGPFDLGNQLSLALGYTGAPLADVFAGEITGLDASFPSSGMPTLTLVAQDRLHRLAQGNAVRGFGLLPDFLVAAILGAENLLVAQVDPLVAGASVAVAVVNEVFGGSGRAQTGQSDLGLLAEIAAKYDADFWAEGDTLHLARLPREVTPRLELSWGRDLIELNPRVSVVGQVAAVAARLAVKWLPIDLVVTVGWDFDREVLSVTASPGGVAEPPGAALTLVDRRIGGTEDIATAALEIVRVLRERLNNRLTATGTAVGDPRIRAGALIRLSGLGPDFSGDYRVADATHTLDASGYRTVFTARREILP